MIAEVMLSGLATYKELRDDYTLEELYLMYEAIFVKRYNENELSNPKRIQGKKWQSPR